MIISCLDLVGSHRKVVQTLLFLAVTKGSARQCPTLAVWARWGGVPKVAPELLPWPVGVLVVVSMGWCWGGVPKTCHRILDGVVCSKIWGGCPRIPTARWGGVPKVGVFQKVVPEWGGVPKVGMVLQKVVSESSMGWCSKSWGGVPKSCPRIPTARWGGVPKSCPGIPTLYTNALNCWSNTLLHKFF